MPQPPADHGQRAQDDLPGFGKQKSDRSAEPHPRATGRWRARTRAAVGPTNWIKPAGTRKHGSACRQPEQCAVLEASMTGGPGRLPQSDQSMAPFHLVVG